jgi:hexosaminidase
MKKKSFFTFLIVFIHCISINAGQNLSLIPVPAKIKFQSEKFVIDKNTQIILTTDNELMRNAIGVLNELLEKASGYSLKVTSTPRSANAVICKLNPAIINPEGYKLLVQKKLVTLEAQTPQGIFYGMQTLRQLLPLQIEESSTGLAEWSIPCVEIEDEPTYSYRGIMLDVGRHFEPKEFVMKFIDMLAYHKMNTFHWHLTEDQGWRIEIKQYPRLTEVGAYRFRTLLEGNKDPKKRVWDYSCSGGFYTQDDVKEVLAYAAKRFVTVIPEIEMPGHALAALASYPQLSCSGGPFEVEPTWGVFNDIYCPKEETFLFLENVLTEITALFPGKYVHIGGDEAPKLRWHNCAHCQDLMKKENIADEHQLQSYFIKRIEKFLESKGKRLIGWDEILEGGLAPNATVMSWRGEEGGIAAAREGHDVIMTPNTHVYLDYYQADPKNDPLAVGSFLPLQKVYSYNPTPAVLTKEEAKHILGIQGNVWTEYMRTPERVEYMAFPRAAAIAETGWAPLGKKDYKNFKSRLIEQFKRYDAMKWNYCKAVLLGND